MFIICYVLINFFLQNRLMLPTLPKPLGDMGYMDLRDLSVTLVRNEHGGFKRRIGWGKPDTKPVWWPSHVPWTSRGVQSGVSTDQMRDLIRACYHHHQQALEVSEADPDVGIVPPASGTSQPPQAPCSPSLSPCSDRSVSPLPQLSPPISPMSNQTPQNSPVFEAHSPDLPSPFASTAIPTMPLPPPPEMFCDIFVSPISICPPPPARTPIGTPRALFQPPSSRPWDPPSRNSPPSANSPLHRQSPPSATTAPTQEAPRRRKKRKHSMPPPILEKRKRKPPARYQ